MMIDSQKISISTVARKDKLELFEKNVKNSIKEVFEKWYLTVSHNDSDNDEIYSEITEKIMKLVE